MDVSLTGCRGVFRRKVTLAVKHAEQAIDDQRPEDVDLHFDEVRRNLQLVKSQGKAIRAPENSRNLERARRSFKELERACESLRESERSQVSPEEPWRTWESSQELWRALKSSEKLWRALESSGKLWRALEHPKACERARKSSGELMSSRKLERARVSTRKLERELEKAQESAREERALRALESFVNGSGTSSGELWNDIWGVFPRKVTLAVKHAEQAIDDQRPVDVDLHLNEVRRNLQLVKELDTEIVENYLQKDDPGRIGVFCKEVTLAVKHAEQAIDDQRPEDVDLHLSETRRSLQLVKELDTEVVENYLQKEDPESSREFRRGLERALERFLESSRMSSGELWRALKGSEKIWRALERSGKPWSALERCEELWKTLESFSEIWRALESFGELLKSLDSYGEL
ncbi:hypothetical protein FHG87_006263 [Trinorchestia longiramus]|nr:hypothetical protein FHG87_006263 [Trinorchestia longiramus]